MEKIDQERLRSFLRDTFEGAKEDAETLLRHMGTDLDTALKTWGPVKSNRDGRSLSELGLSEQDQSVALLGSVYEVGVWGLQHLEEDGSLEPMLFGAIGAESLLKKVAGRLLGLQLEKAERLKLGASIGGKKSARTRRANSLASPDKVVHLATEYLAAGCAKHEVNSKVADRLKVSRDYVARIRRAAKKKPGMK